MKRTLLSVLIANTVVMSSAAFAADDRGFSPENTFFDNALKFGGHIGSSIEYEDKTITNFEKWGGGKSTERTLTHEVLSVFYNNPIWDATALYALKIESREKRDGSYAENEDSYKHFLSLNKGFQLGGGWGAGLIYDIEYSLGKIVTSRGVHGLRTSKAEHSLRPYLTYWNNEYSTGFYSNIEYLYNDEDKSTWGTRKEEGYSLLFKPYMNIGNWSLGVEFFYQEKDNKAKDGSGKINEKSDFTEKYIEPIIQYTFDDAGTMYVRTRIGESETKHTEGWAKDEKFFKNIRKATLGYEQAVGDNWLVKAEYEWAKDTETFTQLEGEEKIVEQNTVFAQALYRF